MKISFVIPAYNEEALIGQCVESVRHALISGLYDAEIIVVNNASKDRTAEIARSYPGVTVIDEARKGLTFARQAGFEAATGDLIANIDADVMVPPGWPAHVIHAFENDPKLVALSGPFVYYDLSRFQRGLVKAFYGLGYLLHLINRALGMGAMLQGGNFVLRANALREAGGFDTSIDFYGEDTDIAKRMAKLGNVCWTFKLPVLASGRRLKEEGIARMAWKYTLNHLSILYLKKPFTATHVDIRA